MCAARLVGLDSNPVLDHEPGHFSAVDEDNLLSDSVGILEPIDTEAAGRDVDASGGLCSLEGTYEALDVRTPDHASG